MKYDSVSVTGMYQGKLMLFIMELTEEEYICKKALSLGKQDKLAIHSIENFNNSVYMADSLNNKIYKYDYISNDLKEETVARDPRHMCIDGENMYVANFESDNISVIDLQSFTLYESIPAGIKPHDILYDNKNKRLYTCCYEENEIIEYQKNEMTRRFTADGKPMHMYLHNDTIILMTYFINGNVHTKINFINIKSGEIEKVILLDGLASDFEIDYIRNMLYVINIVDKNLYILDISKKEIVKLIYIGGYPECLTLGNEYLYVTNSKKNQIYKVDCDYLIVSGFIELGFTPYCIKVIKS